MNEQELRALVREAVERHLGTRMPSPPSAPTLLRSLAPEGIRPLSERNLATSSPSSQHSSHVLLKVVPGSEANDGMCVIEPSVQCNHCGFCQSYGH